jgi:hypothetical protein
MSQIFQLRAFMGYVSFCPGVSPYFPFPTFPPRGPTRRWALAGSRWVFWIDVLDGSGNFAA